MPPEAAVHPPERPPGGEGEGPGGQAAEPPGVGPRGPAPPPAPTHAGLLLGHPPPGGGLQEGVRAGEEQEGQEGQEGGEAGRQEAEAAVRDPVRDQPPAGAGGAEGGPGPQHPGQPHPGLEVVEQYEVPEEIGGARTGPRFFTY